jgi:hypothetical protein
MKAKISMRISSWSLFVAAALFSWSALGVAAPPSDSTVAAPSAGTKLYSICAAPVKSACLSMQFDAIRDLAQHGDAAAAGTLYRSLEGCNASAISNPSAMQPTSVSMGPDGKLIPNSDPKNNERMIKVLKSIRDRCAYFSREQVIALDDIRWIAASAGDQQAQHGVVSVLTAEATAGTANPEYVANLVPMLEKNMSNHSIGALSELSRIYYEGVLVPQDYIKSYAYQRRFIAIAPAAKNGISIQHLQAIAAHLSADQIQTAEMTAKSMAH